MSDYEAIQGLWEFKSRFQRGESVDDVAKYYLFSKNEYKRIVGAAHNPKLRANFKLEEESEPKSIVITIDFNGPDGPPIQIRLLNVAFIS